MKRKMLTQLSNKNISLVEMRNKLSTSFINKITPYDIMQIAYSDFTPSLPSRRRERWEMDWRAIFHYHASMKQPKVAAFMAGLAKSWGLVEDKEFSLSEKIAISTCRVMFEAGEKEDFEQGRLMRWK